MSWTGPLLHRLRSSLEYRARRRAAQRALQNANPANAILIFGLSRSGSTWLQETVGAWPGTLSLFEPIHRKVGGSEGAFTLEDVGDEGAGMSDGEARVVRGMLQGELLTPRVLPAETTVPADTRRTCVKLINCNNGLPRLVRDVRLRYLPLAIVRHPCAHVASWKRLGWGEKFGGLAGSYPRLLAARPEWGEQVQRLSTPLEQMAAGWCLGNYVPLREDAAGRWKVVRYEAVQANPEKELAEIFQTWGEARVPAEVVAAAGKASRTTWRDGGTAATADTWREELSETECATVFDVCARFGVNVDYDGYARP